MEMSHLTGILATVCIAGVAFFLGRSTVSIAPASGAGPQASSAALSPQVRDAIAQEVQRQLPAAILTEVRKQLRAMVALSEEEQAAAWKAGREMSIASTLQTLRSQLMLYKIQHLDRAPTMGQMTDWGILIKATDTRGKITSGGGFGPYIQAPCVNPFTGKSKIVAAGSATMDAGWTWNEKQGQIRAVMPAGEVVNLKSLDRSDLEVVK